MNDIAIAGVAQLSNRISDLADSVGPLEMLEQVAGAAIADAGGTDLGGMIDAVVVIPVPMWNPPDPARVLAERLGLDPREGWVTAEGGEAGVAALNWAAGRVGAGELRGVLIVGANTIRTLELSGRTGSAPDWMVTEDPSIPQLGLQREGHSEMEAAAGLDRPVHVYPVIENALRAAHGRTIPEHQQFLGELFAPFTRVAAHNPHAWFPLERTPEELSAPTADNRIIAFPYTKLLNAVLATDQASAVFLGDRAELQQRGADPDRLVSWWGGAEDKETAFYVSSRPAIAACPSMASAHSRTLGMAGVGVDDIARFDLYSCFPAAVEMACDVLGLDPFDPRGLTMTGGLPYAGGPASAYTLHSIAAMVDHLRTEPDELGLVTGNGWYLTKHSSAVLGSRPRPSHLPDAAPPSTFHQDVLPVVQRGGTARITSYTVVHDRAGAPEAGLAILEFDDGSRTVARSEAPSDELAELETRDHIGVDALVTTADDGPASFEPR